MNKNIKLFTFISICLGIFALAFLNELSIAMLFTIAIICIINVALLAY